MVDDEFEDVCTVGSWFEAFLVTGSEPDLELFDWISILKDLEEEDEAVKC